MLKRDKYLILLNEEKNSNFIKVLTGIRRVGKSTLLNQFKETCQNDNIIEFDFNELNQCVYTYETLHDEIIKRTIENKTNVVILDEIQEIENFEKCIISLYSNKKYKYDIYITGSNSHMFSAELVTLFTGRTMEYVVFPFSFKEINEYIFQNTNAVKQYEYYLMHGGLGAIVDSYLKSDRCYKILENVFNTILKKDLVDRYNIRNTDGFEKITKYVFNHIGRNISASNLEHFLVSNKEIKVTKNTLLKYFDYLNKTFLTYRINYFDIKGKKILQTKFKYYATDLGILTINTNTDETYNLGYRLENLVLINLLEQQWKVFTSCDKYGNEIDFVIKKNNITKYIQVCDTLNDKNYERESRSLLKIRDGFEKIILCNFIDLIPKDDGINIVNIKKWLLEESKF